MPSRRPSLATRSDAARRAVREIRRLSEALALARFEQVLDEASEWVMWVGAAVPPARGDVRGELAPLREASRGFERWLSQNTGIILALDSELVRRAERVRAAALTFLRDAGRARGDLEAGCRALEASTVDLERALARARADVRRG